MTAVFDGPDVNADDAVRLESQLERVKSFMRDGAWHTLRVIAKKSLGSEASASARLRDLRKARFGSYHVERRRSSTPGVWEYRLVQPQPVEVALHKLEGTTKQLGLALETQTVEQVVTKLVRSADQQFMTTTGGSSRHWVRDLFLPGLDEAGFRIVKK